jgi:hypothetical protein
MFNSNASSADAGGADYIEDVFSTWLYTGNGSTQTITNGVDLSTKGGLVWAKPRSSATSHCLIDTARGTGKIIYSDATAAQATDANALTAFNTTGYSMGGSGQTNSSGVTYASWTFRKQPKFFDVVTYTGNGTAGRQIAHSLGSTPGFLVVKRTDSTSNWSTWHTSIPNAYMSLDTTNPQNTDNGVLWGNGSTHIDPTSTVFTVSSNAQVNASGGTYVAYLFAHNAGGFGLTGTDNVISCGSYTGTGGAGNNITLGYEPQWVLVKNATTAGWDWYTADNMRGFVATPASPTFTKTLSPNTSGAESDQTAISPTATGFVLNSGAGSFNASGNTYIYIAIRRGPMKVPTDGTEVFSPNLSNAVSGTAVTTGFPLDLQIVGCRPNYGLSVSNAFMDRLRGVSTTSTQVGNFLAATSTDAEVTNASTFRTLGWGNTGYNQDTYLSGAGAGIYWNFRRAPGFFDEVCYTGTGSTLLVNHNLGVPPELIITKRRNATSTLGWIVSSLYWYASLPWDRNGRLNQTNGLTGGGIYIPAGSHSATQYPVDAYVDVNDAGGTYVSYLFATCPGVSKVGLYTGTGTTQQINCGFTAGSRFVMIKRADDTGDWYVWDSARGIVAGNDPYLLLNSTAAEVTSTDYVDTYSAGFELTATAPAAINASGGSYVFLAIA